MSSTVEKSVASFFLLLDTCSHHDFDGCWYANECSYTSQSPAGCYNKPPVSATASESEGDTFMFTVIILSVAVGIPLMLLLGHFLCLCCFRTNICIQNTTGLEHELPITINNSETTTAGSSRAHTQIPETVYLEESAPSKSVHPRINAPPDYLSATGSIQTTDTNSSSISREIQNLNNLRLQGVLSEIEFEAAKAKLLGL